MPPEPSDPGRYGPAGGEEALIAEYWAPLADGFPGAFSLKDDCATITPPPGSDLITTTDALIAGVHFFPGDDPASLGWKALAVNVSDLVAKGGAPFAYLLSVALPSFDRPWLQAFSRGLGAAQAAFGCHLAGGDTDRTPGPLTVTITAFGILPAGTMVHRSTAKAGDIVYVSGTIGDATLGLRLRTDPQLSARWHLDDHALSYLAGKFSRPHPPLQMAPVLRTCASAAMDISDGLLKDLDRLCRASGVAGTIEAASIPLSAAARAVISAGGADLATLMTGGEDYEILVTVPSDRAAEFERLSTSVGAQTTRIGSITDGIPGAVGMAPTGEVMHVATSGWDHFAQR